MIRISSFMIVTLIAAASYLAGCQRGDLEHFEPSPAVLQPIYIFNAGLQVGGTLGGRAGADATCRAAAQSQLVTMEAAYVKAFLSVNEYDELKYVVPISRWASPVFGMKTDGTLIQISADWNSLWDGTIDVSLKSAVEANMNNHWTGSTQYGTYSTDQTCNGWTDSMAYGMEGSATNIDYQWMDNGAIQCDGADYLLCVGF